MLDRVYQGAQEYPDGHKSSFTGLVFKDGETLNIQRISISHTDTLAALDKSALTHEASYLVAKAVKRAYAEMGKEFNPSEIDDGLYKKAINLLVENAHA